MNHGYSYRSVLFFFLFLFFLLSCEQRPYVRVYFCLYTHKYKLLWCEIHIPQTNLRQIVIQLIIGCSKGQNRARVCKESLNSKEKKLSLVSYIELPEIFLFTFFYLALSLQVVSNNFSGTRFTKLFAELSYLCSLL